MKKTSEVIACVVDNGSFLHVARRLSKDLKCVYYTTNPDQCNPKIEKWCIGDGYPEIVWVNSLDAVADKIDLCVFANTGYSSAQQRIRRAGVATWGGGPATALESHRGRFLNALKETSLPVPVYKEITGVAELGRYLNDKEDKYIKISRYRGNMETTHFRSMREDCGVIANWVREFGPFGPHIIFYVFDPIETKIEGGSDSWFTGQWPRTVFQGFEKKNKAYLMTFQSWEDLPEEIRMVNEQFAPMLDGYNGPFSTEIRITEDGKSYFLDPTIRYGSPVSQLQCDLLENFGEIVWMGANGIMVEPEQSDKFGIQATFDFDRSNWIAFEIPDDIEPHVKIGHSCLVDGVIWVPPDPDCLEGDGWVCATGSTIEYALHNLKKYSEEMPCGVEVRIDVVADLLKEVHESEAQGMEFTDQEVPEPETVVD